MSTWLLTLGFLALAGVGVVLPALIHRGLIVSRSWSRILALCILLFIAGLITLLVYLVWHFDPGAMFTRVFLVDGISLYILNNAPAKRRNNVVLIQLKDLPYFVMIVIGVVLPELYLRFHWRFYTLAAVRMVTLLAACILATLLNHLAYPTTDTGTIFVRAFIYIGICRMIILSSHEVSEKGNK